MKRTNTAVWREEHQHWRISVQKDGKRRSFYSSSVGRKGQREANKKADAWLDDNIENENERIKVLFDKHVTDLKTTVSKSTWVKVESAGKNWIIPEIGNKRISAINEQHLQNIINKAFAKGLKKKSLQNIKATILAFFKFCRKNKATSIIPESLTIPKSATANTKRILQPADLTKLFNSDITILCGKEVKDKYINAYRFQVLTGIRPGELMALRVRDITGNTVHINGSKNYLNEITKGKNENATRKITLNSMTKEVLDNQIGKEENGYVFGDMNLSTYAKRWKIYCDHNSINYVSLYELRHTFVSIAKRLPAGEIKPLLGHSKNMDTFGTYGHEVDGEAQATANKVKNIFVEVMKINE